MRKTRAAAGLPGFGRATRALGLVLLAAGLWIPTFVAAAPAFAQERGSAAKPATASRGADSGPGSGGGDDISIDTGDDGKDGSARGRRFRIAPERDRQCSGCRSSSSRSSSPRCRST